LYSNRKVVGRNIVFWNRRKRIGRCGRLFRGTSYFLWTNFLFFSLVLFNKNVYRPKFGQAHSFKMSIRNTNLKWWHIPSILQYKLLILYVTNLHFSTDIGRNIQRWKVRIKLLNKYLFLLRYTGYWFWYHACDGFWYYSIHLYSGFIVLLLASDSPGISGDKISQTAHSGTEFCLAFDLSTIIAVAEINGAQAKVHFF